MKPSDLLVIVPSRGRPHSVEPLARAWRTTGAEADLVFALDDDDPALDAYLDALRRLGHQNPWIGPRRRLVGTLNEVATALAPDFAAVGFMGDDHRPRTPGWDRRFAECLSAGAGIVYGNDLLVGEQFPTAVMMTSDIIMTLGYMTPPSLTHLNVDMVWKDWGTRMGRITYLSDVVIEHVHPHAGKVALDEGYLDVNSSEMVAKDAAAYYAYRDYGGLTADLVKLKELL